MKVHSSRSVRRTEVTTDGRNLVSHAGTAMLSELGHRTGLTHAFSVAMPDCGVLALHLTTTITDGTDARGHESTNEISRLQAPRLRTQDSRLTQAVLDQGALWDYHRFS